MLRHECSFPNRRFFFISITRNDKRSPGINDKTSESFPDFVQITVISIMFLLATVIWIVCTCGCCFFADFLVARPLIEKNARLTYSNKFVIFIQFCVLDIFHFPVNFLHIKTIGNINLQKQAEAEAVLWKESSGAGATIMKTKRPGAGATSHVHEKSSGSRAMSFLWLLRSPGINNFYKLRRFSKQLLAQTLLKLQIKERQSLVLLLMPEEILLFLATDIKKTTVCKTTFKSEHLDTVQSQSTKCFALVGCFAYCSLGDASYTSTRANQVRFFWLMNSNRTATYNKSFMIKRDKSSDMVKFVWLISYNTLTIGAQ